MGDDPLTAGVNEVQKISCSATGGTMTITFRNATTSALSATATATEVKTALEALDRCAPARSACCARGREALTREPIAASRKSGTRAR